MSNRINKDEKNSGITISLKTNNILNRLYVNTYNSTNLPDNICEYIWKLLICFILIPICWPSYLINFLFNKCEICDSGKIYLNYSHWNHLFGLIIHFIILSISLDKNLQFYMFKSNYFLINIIIHDIVGTIILFIILLSIIIIVFILLLLFKYGEIFIEYIKIKIKWIDIKFNYFKKLKENNCLKIKWK